MGRNQYDRNKIGDCSSWEVAWMIVSMTAGFIFTVAIIAPYIKFIKWCDWVDE